MDLSELVELETAMWRALVRGDAAADAGLLDGDFLGVDPTGFAARGDHVGRLAGGPTVAHFELSHARTLAISPDANLLAYRADYVTVPTPDDPHPSPRAMYVSSLWCRRDGRWLNVFSQDTPATGEQVP